MHGFFYGGKQLVVVFCIFGRVATRSTAVAISGAGEAVASFTSCPDNEESRRCCQGLDKSSALLPILGFNSRCVPLLSPGALVLTLLVFCVYSPLLVCTSPLQ